MLASFHICTLHSASFSVNFITFGASRRHLLPAMTTPEKDLGAFLQQHKVPSAVANELATSLTFGAFAMLAASPDELSTTLQASLSSEAVAMLTPFVLANMKAAWSAALAACASGSSAHTSAATTLDASKSASDVASWSDTFPPKLSTAFTKQIITRFESSYPGDILDDSNTPSSRLLALCNKYLSDKSFKYIPWHLRLSDKTQEELSLHRPRKVPRLEDLLWDDVPSLLVISLPMVYLKCFFSIYLNWYRSRMPCWRLRTSPHSGSTTSFSFRWLSADTSLMLDCAILLSLNCSRRTGLPGRPSVTCAFAAGVWTMLSTKLLKCAAFCIPSYSPGQPLLRLFVCPKVVAKARRARVHYLPAVSKNGSLPSQTLGARSWSFARVGTFAAVAIGKIANSFTSVALMLTVSLACPTIRLTSTLEEATRNLGRLSSGRYCLSPLRHYIPIQCRPRLRHPRCQFLLRHCYRQTLNLRRAQIFWLCFSLHSLILFARHAAMFLKAILAWRIILILVHSILPVGEALLRKHPAISLSFPLSTLGCKEFSLLRLGLPFALITMSSLLFIVIAATLCAP